MFFVQNMINNIVPIYILFVDPTVCLSVSSDFPVAASRGIIFAKTEYLEMSVPISAYSTDFR